MLEGTTNTRYVWTESHATVDWEVDPIRADRYFFSNTYRAFVPGVMVNWTPTRNERYLIEFRAHQVIFHPAQVKDLTSSPPSHAEHAHNGYMRELIDSRARDNKGIEVIIICLRSEGMKHCSPQC